MDFRAQTTTSPLVGEVYAVLKSSPERLEEGRKKKRREKNTISSACCLLKEVQYSLLSLWYHGCVGQDPVNCGYSSVDVFRESCRCFCRTSDLLSAGWNPVFVRHHPDRSLLQNQDQQC